MKHLIIPTDFSLRSLEPIRAAVRHFEGEPVTITLLHLLHPPTDIIDGLRLGYRSSVRPQVPAVFKLAVESMSAVLARQVHAMKVDVRYGNTVAFVRNLLDALGADAVVYNPQMPFETPAVASFDPRPVLRRAMKDAVIAVGEPVQQAADAAPVEKARPVAPKAERLEPSLS